MAFAWVKYEEEGLTGRFRLGKFEDGWKMLVEVTVKKTRTVESVERYPAYRLATPEDLELARMTKGRITHA